MKKFATLVLISLLAIGPSLAQADVEIDYKWDAPTTGSPVDHYIIEIEIDGVVTEVVTDNSTPAYTHSYTPDTTIRLRVKGVDALGYDGPFSVWSEYFSYAGPPGACSNLSFSVRRI